MKIKLKCSHSDITISALFLLDDYEAPLRGKALDLKQLPDGHKVASDGLTAKNGISLNKIF